jgi:excinuclease UvrABC ATPase subunit
MPQEYIEIRGARENNLKKVSLRIPKAPRVDWPSC